MSTVTTLFLKKVSMLNGQVLSILWKATQYNKFVVFGNSLFFNGHLKINSFVFNNVKMQVNRSKVSLGLQEKLKMLKEVITTFYLTR